mmetsp:Transcript_64020/g.152672  ORF Transcript_64020/g.152672 Transcript_64020/m.152672 type:complete len:223 (-) Transcript_64020:612-1280(-)
MQEHAPTQFEVLLWSTVLGITYQGITYLCAVEANLVPPSSDDLDAQEGELSLTILACVPCNRLVVGLCPHGPHVLAVVGPVGVASLVCLQLRITFCIGSHLHRMPNFSYVHHSTATIRLSYAAMRKCQIVLLDATVRHGVLILARELPPDLRETQRSLGNHHDTRCLSVQPIAATRLVVGTLRAHAAKTWYLRHAGLPKLTGSYGSFVVVFPCKVLMYLHRL